MDFRSTDVSILREITNRKRSLSGNGRVSAVDLEQRNRQYT